MTFPITANSYFNNDPTCRQIGDRFWIFCARDQTSTQFQAPEDRWWMDMFSYEALSTRDFQTYTHHGSLFSTFDLDWVTGTALWDGDAGIPANGAYYAYAPFWVEQEGGGEFQIAVLKAEKPEGPYRDVLGKPMLVEQDLLDAGFDYPEGSEFPGGVRKGFQCLSPTVVYDEEEKPWMLVGQFYVYLIPLDPSMEAFSGPPIRLDMPYRAGEACEYIEGPMLQHIGGKWRLTYMSYKNWEGRHNPLYTEEDPFGPHIRICTADSMFGPFREPETLIYPIEPNACNNQHALAPFNGNWKIVYHIPWRPGAVHRQLVVEDLKLDKEGNPVPIHPFRCSEIPEEDVPRLGLAARATRWAQEFMRKENATVVEGPRLTHAVNIQEGGWIAFDRMLFDGRGPMSIQLTCLENSEPGILEIRLDALDGPVLAELDLRDAREAVAELSAVQGTHNLLIRAVEGNPTLWRFRIL